MYGKKRVIFQKDWKRGVVLAGDRSWNPVGWVDAHTYLDGSREALVLKCKHNHSSHQKLEDFESIKAPSLKALKAAIAKKYNHI